MLAGETILQPTRRYTIAYLDGHQVDVDAQAMWPNGPCLEFTVTVAVVGIPRLVVCQRVLAREVERVEREDGAVWLLPER